jgi:hypothetical protein
MIKHKKKNLKPTDMSLSLIYRCPNCSNQHWLSLNQAKTKKFIVVCDCDHVFKVKPVENIRIIYQKTSRKKEQNQPVAASSQIADVEQSVPEISQSILDSCSNVLKKYGFTASECHPLIKECYNSNPKFTAAEIIKFCITKFGVKNG